MCVRWWWGGESLEVKNMVATGAFTVGRSSCGREACVSSCWALRKLGSE